MKKKILVLIAGIVLAFIVAAAEVCYFMPVNFGGIRVARPEPLPGDTWLTKEQVAQDREQLITYVENVHPFFVDGSDQTAYQAAKAAFIAATEKDMTVDKLMVAAAKYLTVFGDGHTRLGWQFGDEVAIYHRYADGKVYFSDGSGLTDKWVTAVDGVPTEQIFAAIDSLFPAENEMAVAINRNNYFTSANLLKTAGLNVEKETFTVSLSDGSTAECGWYVPVDEGYTQPEENRWFMEDDIFVVRFVECTDDDNLKAIADELKKAVNGGCTKVIIDARGNGGGSSNACERLLNAMGMKAPSYGMLVRYSKEAKAQLGYVRSCGTCLMQPNMNARQNDKVRLAVLCDRYTYSSATMLCVFVQDGKLGTLIGEASSNMPNSYGDLTYVALDNSHLYASVSHKRFLRPSGETDSRTVVPDIETSSLDAMQAALDFMAGK